LFFKVFSLFFLKGATFMLVFHTQGRVLVNGKAVPPATMVGHADNVTLDGKALSIAATRLWKLHKIKGQVVSHSDELNRTSVFDHIAKTSSLPRVVSVGRLDYNSEGLLLLTNNGDFARMLEHPASRFERVYKVRAYGQVSTLPSLALCFFFFLLMGWLIFLFSSSSNHPCYENWPKD
jgi:16S rRNA U516 pseudouridylate synthase RsuA-like enzyme